MEIEKLHKQILELRALSLRMENLSGSFYAVGNPTMGKKLEKWAQKVDDITDALDDFSGDMTSEFVAQVEQSSRNTLFSTLAGVELGRRGEDEDV